MATAVVAIIVALVILGTGAAYFFSTKYSSQGGKEMEDTMMKKEKAMMKDSSPIPIPDDIMMKKEGEAMIEKESDVMMKKNEGTSMMTYSGVVLAGTSAPLLDFTKADFDAAVKTDKLIALYFFANWCPNCRVEFPIMQSVFNELATDQVIGFRVNYNDNETDDVEKALARQYGIAYQHTKVFIKNGLQVLKSPETWTKERYITEITNANVAL